MQSFQIGVGHQINSLVTYRPKHLKFKTPCFFELGFNIIVLDWAHDFLVNVFGQVFMGKVS